MKKLVSLLLCAVSILSVCILSSCTMADKIEEGTYICKTPYIKYIFGIVEHTKTGDEIEVDREVYKALTQTGYDGTIVFLEYQEEDADPNRGFYDGNNEIYAKFNYKFDDKKKQLILTDWETGNVYHLDKVEE